MDPAHVDWPAARAWLNETGVQHETLTLCSDGWFPSRQVVVIASENSVIAGAAVVHLEPDCNADGGVSVDARVQFLEVDAGRDDRASVVDSLTRAIDRHAKVLSIRNVHGLEAR